MCKKNMLIRLIVFCFIGLTACSSAQDNKSMPSTESMQKIVESLVDSALQEKMEDVFSREAELSAALAEMQGQLSRIEEAMLSRETAVSASAEDVKEQMNSEGVQKVKKAESTSEAALQPTGYPTGEVQRIFLYFENQLWVPEFDVEAISEVLPDSYVYVSYIMEINNQEVPAKELTAAHLSEGTEIYRSEQEPGRIIVRETENRFHRYIPFKEDQSVWNP